MTAATYQVTNLPNETESLTSTLNGQYAGYMPITGRTKDDLFFWYFPSANTSSQDLVVWLNGGPGCSSLFGSWVENGPIRATSNGTLIVNPNSWHHQANLLYVEQPLGTGFSAVQNASSGPFTEYQSGSQFVVFLNGFYASFPEAKGWNLYLTGESWAGTYIPYIGAAIQKCKKLVDGSLCDMFSLLDSWYSPLHNEYGIGNTCLDYYNVDYSVPCGNSVDQYFLAENFLGKYFNFLAGLIASGVKLVMFTGDRDFVVNYVGVEESIGNLTWGGHAGFNNSPVSWVVNSVPAGLYWSERGLTYVRVFDAGHMVSENARRW
ncbi:Cell death protease [Podochytrium sp. JEL0797]|nr:Cell death protease [Podochytrium sp. JEL0797]